MVSYLNKLLWQSKRRRSVDISSRRIPLKAKNINNKDAILDDNLINNNNQDKKSPGSNNNGEQSIATNRDLEVSIKSIKSTLAPVSRPTITTPTATNNDDNHDMINKENPTQSTKTKFNTNIDANKSQLRPMDLNLSSPLVLYAVALSALMAVQLIDCNNDLDIRRLDNNSPQAPSATSSGLSEPVNQRASPFVSTIDWHRIGSRLAQQLASPVGDNWRNVNSNRWSYGPNDHNTRDSYRYPPGRENYLVRTFNRLRNRIGSRNTIRVHNAFRDFAWQVLSRLSMPTPVIYELRRQHFYSPDEDIMNDSFYNKNTTRTIRTKRLLDNLLDWQQANKPNEKKLISRAYDDDDDEPEGFIERLRMRLDDLVSLSRRSLFGRVIRVPAIFPFKRHEEDDRLGNRSKDKGATKQASNAGRSSPRRRNQRFSVRRRKKESDRQMIQINGKQYYVDDDGELKELNKDSPAV